MFKLSKRSKDNYDTLHEDLRVIIDEALKVSSIDFVIVEGHRSADKQLEYYKKGRTYAGNRWIVVDESEVITDKDGTNNKGKHNYNPSMAFDFCIYVPNKPSLTYDRAHMAAVGHMFVAIGNRLYQEGKITHKVRWGANWDMDSEIITDHRLVDLPHIELV